MKQMLKQCVWAAGLLLSTVTFAVQAPEDVVRSTVDGVLAKVKAEQVQLQQDQSRLHALVTDMIFPNFDFQRASQLVLGKNWRVASDDQKSRFISAFKDLMMRTYANALFQFVDETIAYKGVEADSDGKAVTVKTLIVKTNSEPAPVNYRMHQKDGAWKVYDVIVGGISLVTTYRDSFAQEISQNGIDGLISHMQAHNAELVSKAPTP